MRASSHRTARHRDPEQSRTIAAGSSSALAGGGTDDALGGEVQRCKEALADSVGPWSLEEAGWAGPERGAIRMITASFTFGIPNRAGVRSMTALCVIVRATPTCCSVFYAPRTKEPE
jgi:hypothetical protein